MSDKHTWWAWAVKNSVSMICFTILAVIFKHWWIVLFSILWLDNLKISSNRKTQENDIER